MLHSTTPMQAFGFPSYQTVIYPFFGAPLFHTLTFTFTSQSNKMSNFYYHCKRESEQQKILEAEFQPRDVDGCPTMMTTMEPTFAIFGRKNPNSCTEITIRPGLSFPPLPKHDHARIQLIPNWTRFQSVLENFSTIKV